MRTLNYLCLFVLCLWVTGWRTAQALPPTSPQLRVEVDGVEVALNWDRADGAEGYRLLYADYPGGGNLNTVELGGEVSLLARLVDGASFYVAIEAYNAEGASYSNLEYFTVHDPLGEYARAQPLQFQAVHLETPVAFLPETDTLTPRSGASGGFAAPDSDDGLIGMTVHIAPASVERENLLLGFCLEAGPACEPLWVWNSGLQAYAPALPISKVYTDVETSVYVELQIPPALVATLRPQLTQPVTYTVRAALLNSPNPVNAAVFLTQVTLVNLPPALSERERTPRINLGFKYAKNHTQEFTNDKFGIGFGVGGEAFGYLREIPRTAQEIQTNANTIQTNVAKIQSLQPDVQRYQTEIQGLTDSITSKEELCVTTSEITHTPQEDLPVCNEVELLKAERQVPEMRLQQLETYLQQLGATVSKLASAGSNKTIAGAAVSLSGGVFPIIFNNKVGLISVAGYVLKDGSEPLHLNFAVKLVGQEILNKGWEYSTTQRKIINATKARSVPTVPHTIDLSADLEELYAQIKDVTFTANVGDLGISYTKSVSYTQRFVVVIVPVSVEGGARGSIGLGGEIGLRVVSDPLSLSLSKLELYASGVGPEFSVGAFANAAVDLVVASGGVGASLTLLSEELDLDASLEVSKMMNMLATGSGSGFFDFTLTNVLKGPQGRIYLFVTWPNLVWSGWTPEWRTERAELNLVTWEGLFKAETVLYAMHI